MAKKRKRILFFVAFISVFLVETLIALYVRGFVRNYMGDVLAVAAVYFFLRVFIPNGCRLLPLYVFLFAVGVEITQYFHLANLLGLQNNRVISTILGGVFDWVDILCYGIGCLIIFITSMICKKINRAGGRHEI